MAAARHNDRAQHIMTICPHSGLANQAIAIIAALNISQSIGVTLVLPPILQHRVTAGTPPPPVSSSIAKTTAPKTKCPHTPCGRCYLSVNQVVRRKLRNAKLSDAHKLLSCTAAADVEPRSRRRAPTSKHWTDFFDGGALRRAGAIESKELAAFAPDRGVMVRDVCTVEKIMFAPQLGTATSCVTRGTLNLACLRASLVSATISTWLQFGSTFKLSAAISSWNSSVLAFSGAINRTASMFAGEHRKLSESGRLACAHL